MHLKDIPKEFWSFHNEGPFEKCIDCDRDLLTDNCEYVIEKAIRNYQSYKASDVIFDYAICTDCLKRIHDGFSRQSLQNIKDYFTEKMDMEEHLQKMVKSEGNVQKMISECMISNTHQTKSEEYQIFAYCIGDKINLQNPPYMLCGMVMSEIAELLSKETRDDLDRFFDKHFSPDPGLIEPVPKIILI